MIGIIAFHGLDVYTSLVQDFNTLDWAEVYTSRVVHVILSVNRNFRPAQGKLFDRTRSVGKGVHTFTQSMV